MAYVVVQGSLQQGCKKYKGDVKIPDTKGTFFTDIALGSSTDILCKYLINQSNRPGAINEENIQPTAVLAENTL